MVACAAYGKPLTSCWSTSKTGAKHAYYMCFEKTCSRNRKSIRHERIEGEFAQVLARVTPNQSLVDAAYSMFKCAWDQRVAQAREFASRCKQEATQIERQSEKLLDRIVEAGSDSVARAYEKRIAGLERQALVLREKSENARQPRRPFDELFELAVSVPRKPFKTLGFGQNGTQKSRLETDFCGASVLLRGKRVSNPKNHFPLQHLKRHEGGV